jgi:hypothetical protein
LIRNTLAVIIQAPEKIEENIDEKKKEEELLQAGDQVLPGESFFENSFEELEGLEQNHQSQKAIENIPYTERYPTKKKPLRLCDPWKKPLAIVLLYPIRIPGCPFDENAQNDQDYPTPAFHQPGKQTGKELLQVLSN